MGETELERRTYYQILHVQPDAPAEIIQAAYRTLMGPLRQHPDRGGSNEVAARLNEAYEVIGDPARRQDYDRLLHHQRQWHDWSAGASHTAAYTPEARPRSAGRQQDRVCPFCRHGLPARVGDDDVCSRCHSPLCAPPQPPDAVRELFGRRRASRHRRTGKLALTPAWGASSVAADIIDLSLSGIALSAPGPVPTYRVVRVTDADFDAVAVVVGCRPKGQCHIVHARFLTLRLDRRSGVMVSARA